MPSTTQQKVESLQADNTCPHSYTVVTVTWEGALGDGVEEKGGLD